MSEESKTITVDILEEVVANEFSCKPSDVNIINHEFSSGSNKGDNFTCVMVSVTVKASVQGKLHEGLSYMVKCAPANEYRASWLEESKGFSRECVVYGTILPRLESLRQERGLGSLKFPKSFYANSEKKVLVMENLKEKEMVLVKYDDITMVHIQTILQELARYHATTYHFLERYGHEKFIEDFPEFALKGWLNDSTDKGSKETEVLMEPIVRTCINLVKTCGTPQDIEKLVPRLEKFEPLRKDKIIDAFEPKGKFDVLVHNDLWTNNMLFKSPTEVKFLDLQFVKRCRPTTDLNYFFCSSTTSGFRQKHFDDLIRLYHNTLTSELKLFGYPEDVYPFPQLIEDFNDCFCFGIVAGFFHSQMRLVPFDGSDGFDIDDWTSDESNIAMMDKVNEKVLKRAKENPDYVSNMIGLFNEAVERKAL